MYKKLSLEQVKKLYAYCEKQEIYNYDVQIELVDHLASGIEEQWNLHPDMSFGWALKKELEIFGPIGILKFEKRLTKQLKKKFNILLLKYMIQFFKLPKIILTVSMAGSFFMLLQLVQNNNWILIPYCIGVSVTSIIYHFFIFPKKFNIQFNDKSFFLIDYLKNFNSRVGIFVQLPYWGYFFTKQFNLRYVNDIWFEFLLSIILMIVIAIYYAYFFYLPEKVNAFFKQNYLQFAN